MTTNYLAKFFMDIVFKGQAMPVIISEVHDDGKDYDIGGLDIVDGKVKIWFNKDYPRK